MNNEILQKEFDMPQLRQMVLDNTDKIEKNELIINKMRMEAAEQTRKNSERDENFDTFRKEHDRYMKSIDERLDRIARLSETSRIEQAKRSRELDEQFKETDRRIRENSEQLKETQKQVKEMYAETNESIRRVSVEFLGVTGHIIEGLVSSSTVNIFKEAGYDLHDSGKNLKRELSSENKKMEVDALLSNESIVVPVEVKAHFTKKKVKRFIRKMEMFKKFFPEYADKEVVAAIAAIHYEADADTFAHDEGLLVIRVNSNDIFSLDPIDESKLRKF